MTRRAHTLALATCLLFPATVNAGEILLTMEAAAAAASSPAVQAARQQWQASQSAREAAGRLPDPTLEFGLLRWPIQPDPGTSRADERAAVARLGISQRLPRDTQLAAQRSRAEADIRGARADHAVRLRSQQEQARQLWILIAAAQADVAVLTQMIADAQSQARQQSDRLARGTTGADAASALSAELQVENLRDAIDAAQQQSAAAREDLRRLIGDRAGADFAALPDPLTLTVPASPGEAPEPTDDHPELQRALAERDRSRAALEAARADLRPDLTVGIAYGHRPDFPDTLSLTLGMALPVSPAQRQQPLIAAAAARVEADAADIQDLRDRLRAATHSALSDWQRLHERLQRYADRLLPLSEDRVTAITDRYARSEATLDAVLASRLQHAELVRRQLALRADALSARARLIYLLEASS